MAELLTVHDPRGYPPKVVGKRLAERPESLDGKLVYLVDCLFDNSENFMRELADWFGKNLPSIRTRLIQPRQSWVDDADSVRRSPGKGTAPFSASACEAPAARRSSGLPCCWKRLASLASRCIPTCLPGSRGRRPLPTACRARGKPLCRNRSSISAAPNCAPTSKATTRPPAARSCARSSRR